MALSLSWASQFGCDCMEFTQFAPQSQWRDLASLRIDPVRSQRPALRSGRARVTVTVLEAARFSQLFHTCLDWFDNCKIRREVVQHTHQFPELLRIAAERNVAGGNGVAERALLQCPCV